MTDKKNKIDRNPNVDYRITRLARELGGTVYLRGKTLWYDQGSGLHDLQLTHDVERMDNGEMRPLGAWDSPENVDVALRKLARMRSARCAWGTTRDRALDVLDRINKRYGECVGIEGYHYAISDGGDCAVFLWTFLSPKMLSVNLVGGPRWETSIQGNASFAQAVELLRDQIEGETHPAMTTDEALHSMIDEVQP